jgi:NADPH-dependent curcumin reductase CurA
VVLGVAGDRTNPHYDEVERATISVTNLQFKLVRIPTGPLTPDCFRLERDTMPKPKEGEVLLKARYMSIDAANRAWMQGTTYRDALGAGTLMAGRAVGCSAKAAYRPISFANSAKAWSIDRATIISSDSRF